jgi:UDP-GlcNAc:undecaprenyl-phosphate GlcNAc-1-phosphate transferase
MSGLVHSLSWPVCYVVLFVESLVLAWLLTPLAGRLGGRFGLVDVPGGRKAHVRPTPRSGGIALFASFWLAIAVNLAAAAFVGRAGSSAAPFAPIVRNVPQVSLKLIAVAVGACWIFAVGLWDDRRPLRPSVKLACQIVAVVPMLVAKVHIVSFIPWPWVAMLLTLAWVVLLINSFNFLDNMDGLSAGMGAIVAAVLAWISFRSGEWLMTAMFVALLGTLLGFLRHNFSPAAIFMGDSGSMFLGYMLGALTVLATYYKRGVPTRLPVLTPLIVLGVPLFDTCSVLWIRWRAGRPLSQGDRNHFSHRLVNLGMTERGAVIFIYVTTLCVGLGALPLRELNLAGALLITLQTVLWFVILFFIERLGKRASEK